MPCGETTWMRIMAILLTGLLCSGAALANPLHDAIYDHKVTQLKEQLGKCPKAWLNQANEKNLTPLILAIREEQPDSWTALLEAGASPNTANSDGWTPLHEAAVRSSLQAVEDLIAKGANVKARDSKQGGTPLHIACFHGNQEICERLLKAGADINVRDREGFPPAFHAKDQGFSKLLQWLTSKGAKSR